MKTRTTVRRQPERRWIVFSAGDIKLMSFDEWLQSSQKPIPKGFKEWEGAHRHWDRSNPVGWAIYCYSRN